MSYKFVWIIFAFIGLNGCGGSENESHSSANTRFSISKSTVQFSSVIGATEQPDPVDIMGNISNLSGNFFVRVEVTDSGIVDASRTQVSGSQLSVAPGSGAALGAGEYQDIVVVRACLDSACNEEIAGSPQRINVSYSVVLPDFDISQALPLFDASLGNNQLPVDFRVETIQGIDDSHLTFTNNVADDLFTFELRSKNHRLEGYQIRYDLRLNDTSMLPPGRYTGIIAVEGVIEGHALSASVPFDLIVPSSDFQVSNHAIALSHLGARHRLTRRIDIDYGDGNETSVWVASTTAPWLDVTPSGTAMQALQISADPKGLTTDMLHTATVTVADSMTNNAQNIQVSFWIAQDEPERIRVIETDQSVTLADNLRPFLYVVRQSSNTAELPPTIDVYNIYTGALVRTISQMGAVINDLAMGADGQYLYVISGFEGVGTGKNGSISVIDLQNDEIINSWTSDQVIDGFQAILRPGAEDIILTTQGQAFRSPGGHALNNGTPVISGTLRPQQLAINKKANTFCRHSSGAPVSVSCGDAFYSDIGSNIRLQTIFGLGRANFNGGSGIEMLINEAADRAFFVKAREFVIIDLTVPQVMESYVLSGTNSATGIDLKDEYSVYGVSTGINNELFRYSSDVGFERFALSELGVSVSGGFAAGRGFDISPDGLVSIIPSSGRVTLLLNPP